MSAISYSPLQHRESSVEFSPLREKPEPVEFDLERADSSLLDPTRYLKGPILTAVALLAAGITGLFVLTNSLAVIAQVQALSMPWQWGGWALLFLGLAAIAYATLRLGGVYLRLRATPRLSADALSQLAQRAALRDADADQLDAARGKLRKLLAEHKVDTDKGRKELLGLGMPAEQLGELVRARKHLLDTFDTASPEIWVREYRTRYVGSLDKTATKLIRRRSLLCGAKTAALPNGGLDTAVVLTHSYLLVADLCRLYRVRTGRRGTMAIMWRVLIGVFIAGQLEDVADAAGDQLGELASGASTGILARAGGAVAGRVVGKAAEGLVNAAFLYRLGRATTRRLRPVA
ncbi:MAG: uncharacterized membrane protein YcjF (UPF0283 family) [Phycisphaerales bacterium]|jgi:uncharacterized membrane protein YcjF (UPF0283 family)